MASARLVFAFYIKGFMSKFCYYGDCQLRVTNTYVEAVYSKL